MSTKATKKPKQIKILFIGDIVGEIGREAVRKFLPQVKEKYDVDFTIANGEHLSERVGLEIEYVNQMHDAGIDLFTTGNHVWRKKGFEEHIGKANVPVIRPANFGGNVPGEGFRILKTKKGSLFVGNLIGKENIDAKLMIGEEKTEAKINSPFDTADKILQENGFEFSVLDFHAEMTSEKVAMGQYLDGKVSCVLGTHTHVPTADNRILPKGTAYISDVGMTGPLNSVLGVKSEIIIERFRTGLPSKFEVSEEGPAIFNSVLVTIGDDGKAKKVQRIDKIVK